MVSIDSVKALIGEAAGHVLLLMQEGDSESGFEAEDWADEMYLAWEHLKTASQHLDRAADNVGG